MGCLQLDEGSQTHMPGKAGGMVRKEMVGKIGRYIGMIMTVEGNICSEQENRRSCHIYHIPVTRTGDWGLGSSLELNTVGLYSGGVTSIVSINPAVQCFSFPSPRNHLWKKKLIQGGFDFCLRQSCMFHLLYPNQSTFCMVSFYNIISALLITGFVVVIVSQI